MENKPWSRRDSWERYASRTNPFIGVTTPVEVTPIVKYCKLNKNFYATMTYCVSKAANSVPAFRTRVPNGDVHGDPLFFDRVDPNIVEKVDDDTIGFIRIPMKDNFDDFMKGYKLRKQIFNEQGKSDMDLSLDEIWISCAPWFTTTAIIPPYDTDNTILQFIWDKVDGPDNNKKVNLTIHAHHGLCDGLHIAKFLDKLNLEIGNFK